MTSDDQELTYFIYKLATSRCDLPFCQMQDDRIQRAAREIQRLRTELDRTKMDKATITNLNIRLAEEMDVLEAKLPHVIIRRWFKFLRGGWRV